MVLVTKDAEGDASTPGHPRGGDFNHGTAKDPGAGGIGARLHTDAVDPYDPAQPAAGAPLAPPQLAPPTE
jgi:hypothetical protein